MHVYMWERISNCTENYHPEGGLLVVAESLDSAIDKARECGIGLTSDELEPDRIWPTDPSQESEVWIFPDAGCC